MMGHSRSDVYLATFARVHAWMKNSYALVLLLHIAPSYLDSPLRHMPAKDSRLSKRNALNQSMLADFSTCG